MKHERGLAFLLCQFKKMRGKLWWAELGLKTSIANLYRLQPVQTVASEPGTLQTSSTSNTKNNLDKPEFSRTGQRRQAIPSDVILIPPIPRLALSSWIDLYWGA